MESFDVIGLMSGTSLDGLDIAYCNFQLDKNWKFKLIYSETIPYDKKLKHKLANLENDSALNYALCHVELGRFYAKMVNAFIKKFNIKKVDLIASHGHTIFHQPSKHLTSQIGCGAQIAALTKINTICDFRTYDVAIGGNGAPLVPIGDELLFSEYEYCLNLGGIANVSFNENKKRISYDIGMANIVNNFLCQKLNKEYDESGIIAKNGSFNEDLYTQLNNIPYFTKKHPKSLGKEYFIDYFLPIIENSNISIEDKLHTFGKHLAFQVSNAIDNNTQTKIIITGGGAYNKFWVESIRNNTSAQVIIPESSIIEFKEAIIFAFLGVLRKKGNVNCLATATGAPIDSSGGSLYL